MTESQLFNHIDWKGSRYSCGTHEKHKLWKAMISSAIHTSSDSNFTFDLHEVSKGKGSPVWTFFAKVRYKSEVIPYVFHYETGCNHIVHWSGSTGCLKKHMKACKYLGNGPPEHLSWLGRKRTSEEIEQVIRDLEQNHRDININSLCINYK